MQHRVRLKFPPDPGNGRLARLCVSTVAHKNGVPFETTEELLLAVDEAIIALYSTPTPSDIELFCTTDHTNFHLKIRRDRDTPASEEELSTAAQNRFTHITDTLQGACTLSANGVFTATVPLS